MADLSNQPINTSYPGLLTLETATTGITQNLQSLQDGLGNNTGFQIAEDRLEGGNLFNIYKPAGIPQYFGNGFSSSAANPGAAGNQIGTFTFYDNGEYSYSAISVNCATLEAGTSVDIAFYNTQLLDTYGYVPYQKLTTEVNFITTSTGIKTATFSTPLTFSGTGPGVYYCAIRYNSPTTPTLRLTATGTNVSTYLNWLLCSKFGLQYNTAGNISYIPFRGGTSPATTATGVMYNTATFPTTFTSTELNTINVSLSVVAIGFLLHTIR